MDGFNVSVSIITVEEKLIVTIRWIFYLSPLTVDRILIGLSINKTHRQDYQDMPACA
jgi:hypothetical protein